MFEKQCKPAYVSPYKCSNVEELNFGKRKGSKNNTYTPHNQVGKKEEGKMLEEFICRPDIRDKIFDILYPWITIYMELSAIKTISKPSIDTSSFSPGPQAAGWSLAFLPLLAVDYCTTYK